MICSLEVIPQRETALPGPLRGTLRGLLGQLGANLTSSLHGLTILQPHPSSSVVRHIFHTKALVSRDHPQELAGVSRGLAMSWRTADSK